MQAMAVENIEEASLLQVISVEDEGESSSSLALPDLEMSCILFCPKEGSHV